MTKVRWTLVIVFCVIAGASIPVSVVVTTGQIHASQREGRTQFCQLFARQHKTAVQAYRGTLEFIHKPHPGLFALYPVLRANLPKLRADIHSTRLPKVCATVLPRGTQGLG